MPRQDGLSTELPVQCSLTAPVAQRTERRPSKPRVGGSNPSRRALPLGVEALKRLPGRIANALIWIRFRYLPKERPESGVIGLRQVS